MIVVLLNAVGALFTTKLASSPDTSLLVRSESGVAELTVAAPPSVYSPPTNEPARATGIVKRTEPPTLITDVEEQVTSVLLVRTQPAPRGATAVTPVGSVYSTEAP